MRKFIVALIAMSVVALGGCTSTPVRQPPVPVPTVEGTPEFEGKVRTQRVGPEVEDIFIGAFEDAYGPAKSSQRLALIDLGYTACVSLDEGATFEEVSLAMVKGGLAFEQAGFVLGASVTAFCDWHMNGLMDWIDTLNGLAA